MKKLIFGLFIWIFLYLMFCYIDSDPIVFKFDIYKSLPVMKVTINNKEGFLLIDSGSLSSILDKEFAEYFGFENEIGDIKEELNGLGGTVMMLNIRKVKVKYGDIVIDHEFKTSDLGQLFKTTGAVGVLGSDYLIKHRLIIDYNSKRILRPK